MLVIIVAFALIYSASAVKGKCEVPENINTLPSYAQEELRDIWKSWKPGTPCDKELIVQNDVLSVLDSLNEELANESGNSSGPKVNGNEYEEVPPIKPSDISKETTAAKGKGRSSKYTDDSRDYIDQTTIDDVAMMQFDNVNSAPFLRNASPEVKAEFLKIWTDDNIPSESLRIHKIQTLAVSLLTSQQLEEYNSWATKRRRVLRAREQELRALSKAARRVLRRMSRTQRDDPVKVHPLVRQELKDFVEQLNRRRSKKLLH